MNISINEHVSVIDRVIFLSGEINLSNATALACALSTINAYDLLAGKEDSNYGRKPIKLYICSNGGIINDMWYMVDCIKHSTTQVDTYCLGYVKNEAFIVFLAGENRFISKHATLKCDTDFFTERKGMLAQHDLSEIKNFIYDQTLLGNEWHSVESFGICYSGSVCPEETSINYGVVDGII